MTRSISLMLLFWIIAALLVAFAPEAFDLASPTATVLVKIAAIFVVAFGYVKVSRHPASLQEALIVGVAWLFLDVVAEIAVTSQVGHAWFGLLGTPAAPALRTSVLLAWIAAPALFVRRLPA